VLGEKTEGKAAGAATELEHVPSGAKPAVTDEEVRRVVFVERLRVLKTTDAIVDTPGFFSREGSHLGSLLLEGFWIPNSQRTARNMLRCKASHTKGRALAA
jgi:hypothetical protein